MSAAVKYLTRKMAKAEADSDMASAAYRKAAAHAEECNTRVWDIRRELGQAINADIKKAKAELSS